MDNGGKQTDAQLVRYLPGMYTCSINLLFFRSKTNPHQAAMNRGAPDMWRGQCFLPSMDDWVESDYVNAAKDDLAKMQKIEVIHTGKAKSITKTITKIMFSGTAAKVPEFTITKWDAQPPAGSDKGLKVNDCWPSLIAPADPGFALLSIDPYYGARPYDYKQDYAPGVNGV